MDRHGDLLDARTAQSSSNYHMTESTSFVLGKTVNEMVCFVPVNKKSEGELFLFFFPDLNRRENTFSKSMSLLYVPESLLIYYSNITTSVTMAMIRAKTWLILWLSIVIF